jgi:hypothetical protein
VCASSLRRDRSPGARRSMNLGRIAIWNMAKTIFTIAMAIWIANNGISIYGKYLLQITGECLVYLGYYSYITGEVSISTVLDLLGLPDGHRPALRGRLKHSPASWATSIALNLLLSAHSFPTLGYFLSCSLACSACTSKQEVPLHWDAPSGSRCGGGSSHWS